MEPCEGQDASSHTYSPTAQMRVGPTPSQNMPQRTNYCISLSLCHPRLPKPSPQRDWEMLTEQIERWKTQVTPENKTES